MQKTAKPAEEFPDDDDLLMSIDDSQLKSQEDELLPSEVICEEIISSPAKFDPYKSLE